MQKCKVISTTPAALIMAAIVFLIVTYPVTKHTVGQAKGNREEAPSQITSEPPTVERGQAITVLPGEVPEGPYRPMFGGPNNTCIAAYGQYVFVLQGNTLYQFAVEGLKIVNKVTLEELQRPKKK